MRGETTERYKIRAGQAVYWEKAEWHGSGADTGMMAIVIEIEWEKAARNFAYACRKEE